MRPDPGYNQSNRFYTQSIINQMPNGLKENYSNARNLFSMSHTNCNHLK